MKKIRNNNKKQTKKYYYELFLENCMTEEEKDILKYWDKKFKKLSTLNK